jgi:hypothetical protein
MSRRTGALPRPAIPAVWVVAAALACGGGAKPESEPAPAAWPTPGGPLPDTAELTRIQPAPDTGAVARADTAVPAPPPSAAPGGAPAAQPLPPAEPAPPALPAGPVAAAPELAGPVEPGVVAPGMTEDQVRAALGAPLYVRTFGEHTYYFYDNGREREAGFLDFVTFRSGRVVDAVFRGPGRRYTGSSSSPPGVTPRPTVAGAPRTGP